MPRYQEKLFRFLESRVYEYDFKHLSGWDLPIVPPGARDISVTLSAAELSRYNYENELENVAVEQALANVGTVLSTDYGETVHTRDLVLAPSMTAAIAIVLHWLRSEEMRTVIADAPYYFSYLNVAERYGMAFAVAEHFVDTIDDPSPMIRLLRRTSSPRAVVLCDPRYVVGRNYNDETLEAIFAELDETDVVIFDHAMDVRRSTRIRHDSRRFRTIDLFSFGKVVAMNGARMSALLAPGMSSQLRTSAGAVFGSHDSAALKVLLNLTSDPRYLAAQRSAVMDLVVRQFLEFSAAFKHVKRLTLHAPSNGILGYAAIDVRRYGRYRLHGDLMRAGIHAMPGQHCGIGFDGNVEIVRINYLLDCRSALETLSEILRSKES